MPYDPTIHGPKRVVGPGWNQKVFKAVRTIPNGRVCTYGEVARALGLQRAARQVGFALAALTEDDADVPWHRVVTASGRLSLRGDGSPSSEQVERLAQEGLACDDRFRIKSFSKVRWHFGPEDFDAPGESSESNHAS